MLFGGVSSRPGSTGIEPLDQPIRGNYSKHFHLFLSVMRNRLPLLLAFLLAGLLGSAPKARASHLLGGDLTYTSLGNNQYRVKFRLYRDCSGIVPSPFTLECRDGGCNATATLTAPLVQQGAVETGNPFCAAVSSGPCQGPAGLPNYDRYTYQATVALPPGNWTLSAGTTQDVRATMANLPANPLYVEATLDNRNQGSTTVANNSPQFDALDIPLQYVCWKQRATITFPAAEPDGDSLAYALAAPLQACGTPVSYNSYVMPPVLAPVSSAGGPCFFSYPGTPSGYYYTPTNPILLGVDTLGNCPTLTGVTRSLSFNQQARSLTFMPGILNPITAPGMGANEYQLAILITEYRRINGVRRVIGTVRREITVVVADCNGNYIPNPVTVTSQSQGYQSPDTTRIDVRTCSYARVTLNATDPNNLRTPSANQLLTVTMPADLNTNPLLLGGGDVGTFSLIGNGTANPHGTFYFQPAPTAVGRTIYFNVRVEDNACPIRGVRNQVFVIRVVRSNLAIATNATGSICSGNSVTLNSTLFRPDSVRNLATSTTLPQTYAYQWTTNPGGNGLPTVTTTRNISVSPTLTTRYFLSISPITTFWAGACGDTSSVVVRVLPGPAAPTVTRSGAVLSSSALTGNQWYRDNVLLPGATSRTLTATTNGAYSVTATVTTGVTSCTSPMSAALTVLSAIRPQPGTSLSVAPNPTPDGRLQVTLTGYAQPVTLTVFDALGRRVTEASVAAPSPQGTTREVNLSGCEAGLYLLQVRTASSLEVRRLVRQ